MTKQVPKQVGDITSRFLETWRFVLVAVALFLGVSAFRCWTNQQAKRPFQSKIVWILCCFCLRGWIENKEMHRLAGQ